MSDPTDDVPWLEACERHAWVALHSLLTTLPAAVDAQLKRDSGLNSFEYTILASLSQSETRSVRMSDLAHFASGSLSRLSHAVTRLERQGWVRRRNSDGHEARCVEAVLTDEGMEAVVAAAPGHVREVRRLVFDVLTQEQVQQLEEIGRTLVSRAAPHLSRYIEQAMHADSPRTPSC
ncbi:MULTISPECIES: MarR family transcriptional regulator [Actinoplanes]|uniref:MarR family winged helix-turn-helix transcriptional regulator n=1 Tax=Actinoplanes TaxID=1865 RepID=UPI001FE129FC|nr:MULTISPECIES: MarR family transcriptional regulator [Actinoplanes]GLY04460.1 MarR family transcriptional regulator [Actinoplanes sp. NBRC 101535]